MPIGITERLSSISPYNFDPYKIFHPRGMLIIWKFYSCSLPDHVR